ncbi:MAG: class I SAM-dependent methyltransferase [Solirubrobacteraceae bacterium]
MPRQDGRQTGDQRTRERLHAHWEIERELADRLRGASRDERTTLYGTVYDELFRRVPDHPQVLRKASAEDRRASVRATRELLVPFLAPGETFLEIGAGDCAVSLGLADLAGRVYAVEVSREIAHTDAAPGNFALLITDGRAIPVPPESVDLAYSNQLIEHLHPDDAAEQVANVFAALRPGGRYICLTPNRLLGPADVSQYFEDEVASGFHLREYSERELRDLFRDAGFGTVKSLVNLRGRRRAAPLAPVAVAEAAFQSLPRTARLRLKRTRPVQKLLDPGGGVVAIKR